MPGKTNSADNATKLKGSLKKKKKKKKEHQTKTKTQKPKTAKKGPKRLAKQLANG